MKKILTWLGSGFFRKLGGMLVYLLIGSLIAIFYLKTDVSLDKLLGIETVYADTISWSSKYSRIYYDDHGTERNYNFLSMPRTHTSDYPITQMEYRLSYSGGFSAGNTYTFSVDYTPVPDTLYVTGLWFSDGTNRFTDVNCGGWSRTNSGSYTNLCAVSPPVDISSSGYIYVRIVYASSYVDSLTSGVSNFSITKGTGAIIQDSAIDIMNNQNELMTTQCSNEWNYRDYGTSNVSNLNVNNTFDISYTTNGTSPKLSKDLNLTPSTTYNLSLNYEANNSTTYMFGLWCIDSNGGWSEIFSHTFSGTSGIFTRNFTTSSTNCSYYRYEFNNRNVSTTTNVSYKNIMLSKNNVSYCIYGSSTNKLDDVNSSINDLTDTLTDDNVSGDVTDTFNFFNEFNLQGAGNFTQIVLLPINFINTLILGNEDDLCFTLKGQRACLPNGKILWNRNNTNCNSDIMLGCATTSTTSAFKTFFSIVVGGYLSYKLLIHIVHMWHKILDPTKDNLEVMKL